MEGVDMGVYGQDVVVDGVNGYNRMKMPRSVQNSTDRYSA